MSLKYVPLANASHFNTLPHSMAGNTHFPEASTLKHEYASQVLGTSNCLSVSKQNNSDGIQTACKSDILKKSQKLESQTVLFDFNGNCSTEEGSTKRIFNGTQLFGSSMDNDKIPTVNVDSIATSNPSKTASDCTSNEICSENSNMQCGNGSTEKSSLKKTSNDIQTFGSHIGNKIPTVDVASIPESNAFNGTSKETCSGNSNVTVSVGDWSSSTTDTKEVLMERYGFIDLHANAESPSKVSDISYQETKVVVQTLSNVSCGEDSFLDDCFDIRALLERKPCEKKWRPERVLDFNEQSDESSRCSIKEEKTSDGNRSFKALFKRKMRKNHEMNLHIRPGKGIRLHDIAHIASNLDNASPSLLSFLHKVLFGSYGGLNNEDALSQTKQNILHFSGFPFSVDSEIFKTKRKCLSKVPTPMLYSICDALLGKGSTSRNSSVEDLLRFLQKPTNNSKRMQLLEPKQEIFDESELAQLKQQAIKGHPVILLHKLSDSYVKELLQSMRSKQEEDSSSKLSDLETVIDVETLPAYDLPNNAVQLKTFPGVVIRVNKARRRIINLLHLFLYGRPGSDESNRLNILEFSGFSPYDSENYRRKRDFLRKQRINDLNNLCSIFSLRVKTLSKEEKVMKFLHYLKASSLELKSRKTTKLQPQNKEIITKKTEVYSERKMKSCEQPIKKLKDFEKICRNIECASPKDLMELNDLLFLKPSNNLEIHQQILEFSSSSFRENSPDFHSRRTLLYYMSFEIIKKMAALLEITDWEEYKNPQDLASTLLKFLMDMKPSVKVRQKIKPRGHESRKKESSSITHRPHLLRVQKDDSCWETNTNGNLSPTAAMHNSTYVKEGYHEENCMQDTSVIVRRISESSYSFTDTRTNEPVTVSDSNSDESLSLYDFIQHPSDKQLEVIIREMIYTNSWSSSMGDLINRVFHCYPKLNLTYRVDFIKAKALEVLHEVQNNANPFGDMM